MTTFDDDLTRRLERLDAAIPEPALPAIPATPARHGPNRRRQGMLLLAAAAVALFGVATLTTVANPPEPDPAVVARDQAAAARLLDDLPVAMGDRCLSLDEAKTLFRARLDALGLSDWTIRDDGRTAESPCVGAAPVGENHEILLIADMGGELAKALDELDARLVRECLGRDEAVAALRAVLEAHGITSPRIEVRGVVSVPVEGGDDYLAHAKAGCYVYGRSQFDQQGAYTWFISGP